MRRGVKFRLFFSALILTFSACGSGSSENDKIIAPPAGSAQLSQLQKQQFIGTLLSQMRAITAVNSPFDKKLPSLAAQKKLIIAALMFFADKKSGSEDLPLLKMMELLKKYCQEAKSEFSNPDGSKLTTMHLDGAECAVKAYGELNLLVPADKKQQAFGTIKQNVLDASYKELNEITDFDFSFDSLGSISINKKKETMIQAQGNQKGSMILQTHGLISTNSTGLLNVQVAAKGALLDANAKILHELIFSDFKAVLRLEARKEAGNILLELWINDVPMADVLGNTRMLIPLNSNHPVIQAFLSAK